MRHARGFIALMSAIIISAILMTVVISGSLMGFNSRFNVLDAESKARSSALADACVDVLLLRLANREVVTDLVLVGSESCQITGSNPYQIQAVFNHSYTNLRITVDPTNYTVTKWEEVTNF